MRKTRTARELSRPSPDAAKCARLRTQERFPKLLRLVARLVNLHRDSRNQSVAAPAQLDRPAAPAHESAEEEANPFADLPAQVLIRKQFRMLADLPVSVILKLLAESSAFVEVVETSERALRNIGLGDELDRELERLREAKQ